jgi:hypothetical protein
MKHLRTGLLVLLTVVAPSGQEPATEIMKWPDGKQAAIAITFDDSSINRTAHRHDARADDQLGGDITRPWRLARAGDPTASTAWATSLCPRNGCARFSTS